MPPKMVREARKLRQEVREGEAGLLETTARGTKASIAEVLLRAVRLPQVT